MKTSTKSTVSPPRAWTEIDINALKHNFCFLRERSGGQGVMAVVKANAYGHGVETVVTALAELSPAFYGVANVNEASEVRALLPEARIYLLGPSFPDEYPQIVAQNFTPCASSMEELHAYAEVARSQRKTLQIHLALDTGMGRGGFFPESEAYAQALLFTHPHLEIEGVGSHLPAADEDEEFTRRQFQTFKQATTNKFKYRHLANSAGAMHYEQEGLNLIRPGLALYGVSPLAKYQSGLCPVMSCYARVSIVRQVPAGQGISYGRTFVTERESRIATLGIGYADGVRRSLSGKGAEVWIEGERAPLIGRVTMDQVMVDVTHLPTCEAGSVAEIFGKHISVTELAQKADTIPWEIYTGISPRVQRVPLLT